MVFHPVTEFPARVSLCTAPLEEAGMKTLDALLSSVRAMGEEGPSFPGEMDLLLYAPCPVKLAVKERVEAIQAEYARGGALVSVHIPMGCTSVDPYDPLYHATDVDQLPGIIASIGFGDFFRKEFVERFVHADVFGAVLPETVSPMHLEAGILDPAGRYVVYGLTPYIFLVDTERLGDLPVPETWGDLLNPVYAGQINMCGDGDDMADAVLMGLYKEYGMDGIERFAANCHGLMHSSRMGKSGGAPNVGGIYIIPYFFAESSRQPGHMRVIWPKDGTAASPLYFLAKQSEHARLAQLLHFFTHGFGAIESARWFLPLGGPLPENLPAGAAIRWVGWDFIAKHDITVLRDMLNTRFRELVRGNECASLR